MNTFSILSSPLDLYFENTRKTLSQTKIPYKKPPLRLLYRIITAASDPEDIVLDPFAGSSTTGIAANLLGRKFIGFEQEESFVELSRLRREALQDPDVFSDMLRRMMQPAKEILQR